MEDNCPKCEGFLKPPYWLKTRQGKVYTIECVQCGWFLYHPTLVVIYKTTREELLEEGLHSLLHKIVAPFVAKMNATISTIDINKYEF